MPGIFSLRSLVIQNDVCLDFGGASASLQLGLVKIPGGGSLVVKTVEFMWLMVGGWSTL